MNPLTRTFGRRFKKRYDPLREGDINPATAFDIALSKAAQEVGYSGWPLPQEWLEAATAIAVKRDGDVLAGSRRERDDLWRLMHEGRCCWCEKDSSEEPFVEGVTISRGGISRQIHGSCLKDMRESGLLSGPEEL